MQKCGRILQACSHDGVTRDELSVLPEDAQDMPQFFQSTRSVQLPNVSCAILQDRETVRAHMVSENTKRGKSKVAFSRVELQPNGDRRIK